MICIWCSVCGTRAKHLQTHLFECANVWHIFLFVLFCYFLYLFNIQQSCQLCLHNRQHISSRYLTESVAYNKYTPLLILNSDRFPTVLYYLYLRYHYFSNVCNATVIIIFAYMKITLKLHLWTTHGSGVCLCARHAV